MEAANCCLQINCLIMLAAYVRLLVGYWEGGQECSLCWSIRHVHGVLCARINIPANVSCRRSKSANSPSAADAHTNRKNHMSQRPAAARKHRALKSLMLLTAELTSQLHIRGIVMHVCKPSRTRTHTHKRNWSSRPEIIKTEGLKASLSSVSLSASPLSSTPLPPAFF